MMLLKFKITWGAGAAWAMTSPRQMSMQIVYNRMLSLVFSLLTQEDSTE
jgi:hypothetical protein